jgi:N-acetyl sugar amidotransferase
MNQTVPYRMCSRCVMDTTDVQIEFDEHGVCNHCRTFDKNFPLNVFPGEAGQQKLQALIDEMKRVGKGKPYDCLIGLSGGVDSSYVAYLVKNYGLRPLAVHFDSGWNSEQAVRNIENIVKKLGIDLYTEVCDWPEMRDLQLSYFKAGVVNADVPMDHAFMVVLFRVARAKKIHFFIGGHNYATESIMPRTWVYDSRDSVNLRAIQKRFGTVKLKRFPVGTVWERLYTRYVFKLHVVNILNYGPAYHKEEAMKVLEKELDWKYYGGKHYESVFTRFYQGYYLPHRFNVDKRRAHLSTMICSGQIAKEAALEELKKPTYPSQELLEQDIEYIPKKLGISTEEFKTILEQPTHSHLEYPHDSKVREFIGKVAKLFSIRIKTTT